MGTGSFYKAPKKRGWTPGQRRKFLATQERKRAEREAAKAATAFTGPGQLTSEAPADEGTPTEKAAALDRDLELRMMYGGGAGASRFFDLFRLHAPAIRRAVQPNIQELPRRDLLELLDGIRLGDLLDLKANEPKRVKALERLKELSEILTIVA